MSAPVIAILLFATVLAAFGQVLLKIGATGAQELLDFANVKVIGGILAYVSSMVLWLGALSRVPLHVVYPFTMFTFVLVGLASVVVLGERPSITTFVGWGVICLGVLLVYTGA